jgi:hypothetical protein
MTLGVLLGLGACRPSQPEPPDPSVTQPISPSLYLELRSSEGKAVAAAQVEVATGHRGQSNERGSVLVQKLKPGGQVVLVRAPGYAMTVLDFHIARDVNAGVRLSLMPRGKSSGAFDPSKGFRMDADGVHLEIPGGNLLDEDGKLIEGQAEAFLAALDLEKGGLVAAPGALQGIPSPGQDPVPLEALAIVALDIVGKNEVIFQARSIGLEGRVPNSVRVGSHGAPGSGTGGVRAQRASPLPKVPVWSLDESTGKWVPTGVMAELVESSTTKGEYHWVVRMDNPPRVFALALPYWWRSAAADPADPLRPPGVPWEETACVEVRIEDEEGRPVAGRQVRAWGVDYLGLSSGLTDADGRVKLEVMRGQAVKLDTGGEPLRVEPVNEAGDSHGNGAGPHLVEMRVPAWECAPGTRRDCYGGPEGTLGRGICHGGREFCGVEGTAWTGTCEGDVRPRSGEICGNALDDDCDGEADNRPTSAVWSLGGSMVTRRSGHTATRLDNGKVLVSGGHGAGLAATEVYDPGSRAWSPAGFMSAEREQHAAAWLPSSKKVLVSGGTALAGSINAAEAYDFVTGNWSVVGSMGTPRARHTLTVLDNDRVLAVGGRDDSAPLASAEVYEPAFEAWVPAHPLTQARQYHTATRLRGGQVLVTGGIGSSGILSTTELYDSASGTWSTSGSMSTPRYGHTATLLANGQVLVTGGRQETLLRTAELYDPETRTWSTVSSMNTPRVTHTATLLQDGRVLVTGGGYEGGIQTPELYEPSADTWTPTCAMTGVRYGQAATLLENGQVLVTGGDDGREPSSSTEVFTP